MYCKRSTETQGCKCADDNRRSTDAESARAALETTSTAHTWTVTALCLRPGPLLLHSDSAQVRCVNTGHALGQTLTAFCRCVRIELLLRNLLAGVEQRREGL